MSLFGIGQLDDEIVTEWVNGVRQMIDKARAILAERGPLQGREVAEAIDPDLDSYILGTLLKDAFTTHGIFQSGQEYRLVTAEEEASGMNRRGVFETSEFESLCASGDVFFEMRYVQVGGRFYVCEWYRLPHLTDIAGGYPSYGGQCYETLDEARVAMQCQARVALREALKPR